MDVKPGDVCVLHGGIVGIRLEHGGFLFLSFDYEIGVGGPFATEEWTDFNVTHILGNINANFLALEKAIIESFPEYNLTL